MYEAMNGQVGIRAECPSSNAVERRGSQLVADALASEARGDLGVEQRDALPAQPVLRKTGQFAVETCLVAGFARVVGHLDRQWRETSGSDGIGSA